MSQTGTKKDSAQKTNLWGAVTSAIISPVMPIAFSCLCLITAFGFGLFFSGYQDIHYAPAAFALFAFALVAFVPMLRGQLLLPFSATILLFTAFFFYVTLSLMWSSVPFASMVTYMVFLSLPLTFFGLLINKYSDRLVQSAFLIVTTAMLILSFWAIVQTAALSEIYGTRAAHPLQNPNSLAALLNLALIPVTVFFLAYKGSFWRISFFMLCSVMLLFAGVLATESRAALSIYALVCALMMFLLAQQGALKWRRVLTLIIVCLLLFAGSIYLNGGAYAERLVALGAINNDGAALARLSIWSSALDLFKQNIWFGTGLGTFYLYYPSVRMPGFDNSSGSWAHMDSLQFGIEMGILAPLLFYAFCIAILVRTHKALKTDRNTSNHALDNRKLMIIAAFGGLVSVFLHSHVSFPLYILPILIVCGILLALLHRETAFYIEKPSFLAFELPKWQKNFMIFVTLCVFSLLGYFTFSAAYGQHHLLKAYHSLNNGQPTAFIETITKSEALSPQSFIDPQVQLAGLYIDLIGPNTNAIFTSEESSALEEQTAALLNFAEQMNPAWGEINFLRARYFEKTLDRANPDDRNRIIAQYTAAITKNRMHYRARMNLASFHMGGGQAQQAWAVLIDGIGYPAPAHIIGEYNTLMQKISPLVRVQNQYLFERQTP